MKMLPALVCSLFVVAQGFAQSTPTTPAPVTETTTAPEVKPAPETTKPKGPSVRIPPPAAKSAAENTATKKADAAKKAEPAKKEEPKIEGVVVACVFEEMEPELTRISLRSKSSDVDVNQIAGQFGGGGHPAAAGARIPGKPLAVQRRVLNAVKKALNSAH